MGSCIAVQVCMIQIPLLILFNAFYVSETLQQWIFWHTFNFVLLNCLSHDLFFAQDVGFVLVFSDIHLWASIFSVILVNYIFMDGKCDYFQGKSWCEEFFHLGHQQVDSNLLCPVCRYSSGGGLPDPSGPLLLCSFTALLLIYLPSKITKRHNLKPLHNRHLLL